MLPLYTNIGYVCGGMHVCPPELGVLVGTAMGPPSWRVPNRVGQDMDPFGSLPWQFCVTKFGCTLNNDIEIAVLAWPQFDGPGH